MRVIVEIDGSVQHIRRVAGYGAVVYDADTGDVLAECSGALGDVTCAVAEWRGLVAGLRIAVELGVTIAYIKSDFRVLVEQVRGVSRVRGMRLRLLHTEVVDLIRQIGDVYVIWVPRKWNKHADRLAKAAREGHSECVITWGVT